MAGLDSFVSGFARGRQLKYAREDRNMAREEREEARRSKALMGDLLFPSIPPAGGGQPQPGQVPLASLAMSPGGARFSTGAGGEEYFGGAQGGVTMGGPNPMAALAGPTASPRGAQALAPAYGQPGPATGAPGAPVGAGGGIDPRLAELARSNPQAALAVQQHLKAQTIEQEQANRDRWGRYLGALDVIDDPQQQQQLWEKLVGEIEATGQQVPPNLRQFSPQAYQQGIRLWSDYDKVLSRKEAEIKADFEKQKELRRSGSTTVNVGPTGIDYGKPPEGYAWVRSPDGSVKQDEDGLPMAKPFKGGPAFEKQQAAEAAKAKGQERTDQTSNVLVQDIDRALSLIEQGPLFTTGVAGQVLSNLGGTSANNVRTLLDTVRANVGFEALNAMRQSSPTGGALGQVTVREIELLQATIGNLEQSQTDDQLKDNLNRLKNQLLDVIHGPGEGPERAKLQFEQKGDGWQDMGDGIRIRRKAQ